MLLIGDIEIIDSTAFQNRMWKWFEIVWIDDVTIIWTIQSVSEMFLCSDTTDMDGVKPLEFSPDHYLRGIVQVGVRPSIYLFEQPWVTYSLLFESDALTVNVIDQRLE